MMFGNEERDAEEFLIPGTGGRYHPPCGKIFRENPGGLFKKKVFGLSRKIREPDSH